jgi:hypothetical protein
MLTDLDPETRLIIDKLRYLLGNTWDMRASFSVYDPNVGDVTLTVERDVVTVERYRGTGPVTHTRRIEIAKVVAA